MRIASWLSIVFAIACAKAVTFGPLDGSSANYPSITAVDSAHPPKSVSVRLDRDAYVVVLLVAPGHSATLVYPRDSTTDNQKKAGTHELPLQIPTRLVQVDSATALQNDRDRQRFDSTNRAARTRNRQVGTALPPLMGETLTYLLVVTSSQPLSYLRVRDKTTGVSIPTIEMEALNAVAKAVKSTIETEPRDWAGYFQLVELVRAK